MPAFHFDDARSFEENVQSFLAAMDEADAEMAKILRDNFDKFLPVIEGDEDPRRARPTFNSAVMAALAAMDAGDAE